MRRPLVGRSVRVASAVVAILLLAACGESPVEPQIGADAPTLRTSVTGQIDGAAGGPAVSDSTTMQVPSSEVDATTSDETTTIGPSVPWY